MVVEKSELIATSKPTGGVMVIPVDALRLVAETEKLVVVDAVPYIVLKEAGVPELDIEIPEGVTDAQVVPTLISSMSAFGVADAFLSTIEAKALGAVELPELLVIPPEGSVPPNEVGSTQIVAISLDAPLKSYLTTIK
jgi:hypothetical protein